MTDNVYCFWPMFDILESMVRLAANRTQVYLDALCKINNLRQRSHLKVKTSYFLHWGLSLCLV
jgi:hypothetical protein